MYFQKIRHPSNFRFADQHRDAQLRFGDQRIACQVRDLGEDLFHVELQQAERWPLDARVLRMLEQGFEAPSSFTLGFDAEGRLGLRDAAGQTVLQGVPGASVGVCGSAWLLQWARHEGMRFYGQGEKVTGLEKSGQRSKFWNVDVWSDHPLKTVIEERPDPQYAAIPYLLIQAGAHWVGVLVDHPGNVFMDTGSNWFFSGQDDLGAPPAFWFGADQGPPAFYLIAGHSAASVTERLQRLVGSTPLPPQWALGHHQSRWGYAGLQDLRELDAAFTAHDFPCDGLWLDIDHMEGYRVFTTAAAHFDGDTRSELAALQARGRRIVPILDPGLKVDPDFAPAQQAREAGLCCLNPEGQPYVGFVWPGRTWFPDYSLPEARQWWAEQVQAFTERGFDGYWIDMNDPAVGAAELDDMRFQRGQWPHWTYHNAYATGMAEATRAGLLAARPDERPFVLSRSAAAGSSRYTAMWTGDNWSNWHHLRLCIPGSINLALSGMPFNGPDVPGFGGDASPELAVAWYKACCLFPFLRNHCGSGSIRQEPWAFGADVLRVIRHFVRLRYKLLPYRMQLWRAQEQRGSAVLRPLFHDFDGCANWPLDRVDDQFLIGPALMQAPLLHEGQQQRELILPGPARWLDAGSGQWHAGPQRITVHSDAASTPMFFREGELLPMLAGERHQAGGDQADIELHLILGRGCTQEARLEYAADDGLGFGYRRGDISRWRFSARRDGDRLLLQVQTLACGWKPLRLRVIGYDGATELLLQLDGRELVQALEPGQWTASGAPLACALGASVDVPAPAALKR